MKIPPEGDPQLEPRERARGRDPVRDRERIEQLWAAFVRRHPRWRERFARRIPTMKTIGARVVPERVVTASARHQSKNSPCACGSGQKYKKCCGVLQ